jgi:hypothetical protein
MWPRKKLNEMPPPHTVIDDPKAQEILRAWVAHNKLHLAFSPTTWDDPAGWGIMTVDLMRHVARAYEAEGKGRFDDVLARVRAGFDAEWQAPTDEGTTTADRKH